MKTIAILALAILVAGCGGSSAKETTANWTLPDGLKDCKIFFLDGPGLAYMRVIRCPNSNTSAVTGNGKEHSSTAVISE